MLFAPSRRQLSDNHSRVRPYLLSDRRRFRVVHKARNKSTDPAPLKVKDVWVEDRRYVVCVNEEEIEHDRAARQAIVANLREHLRRGDKSLVGNQGYRRVLRYELQARLTAKGRTFEWADVIRDLCDMVLACSDPEWC
jgi:hypothetical protein